MRRVCLCGSGKEAQWIYDAQGIELCRACNECKASKLSGFRSCILSGYTQRDVDEEIEPEEYYE